MNYQDKFTVTLGQYKGVKYPKMPADVSEQEIQTFINNELNKHAATITVEGPAELGHTVVIDYAGFLGEEQFQGGTAEKYPLQLGSGSFIPGFEEQLVGASAGDDVDVNVTFPEQYHAAELAGQAVVFKCKVHEVQKQMVPELTDDFVQKTYNMENVAALRQAIVDNIRGQKMNLNQNKIQQIVVGTIMENSQIELGEAYMNDCVDQMLSYFSRQLAQQGMTMEMYCQFSGMTMESIRENIRPEAENSAKATAVLAAVVEAENITVTDEEIQGELERMAQSYQMSLEELKAGLNEGAEEGIRMSIASTKALELVITSAVEEE